MDAVATVLLEEQDRLREKIRHYSQVKSADLIQALDAVVALHTHVLTGNKMRGKAGLRKRCTECGFAYPCPTIQVIDKEMQ
jgi:hypothetical protein